MPKSKKDYPMVLKANHIAEIMDISLRMAYETMDDSTFPLVRYGKRGKRVSKDAFFDWLDKKVTIHERVV